MVTESVLTFSITQAHLKIAVESLQSPRAHGLGAAAPERVSMKPETDDRQVELRDICARRLESRAGSRRRAETVVLVEGVSLPANAAVLYDADRP